MATCSANFCTLDLTSAIYVVNNGWNIAGATGSQSIETLSPTSWKTVYDWNRSEPFTVTSYAAAILGWHFGWHFTPAATKLPRQLSSHTPIVAVADWDLIPDAACGV